MRKNFGVQTWLYPMPVLVIGTYDDNFRPDAMVAAWGGINDTDRIGVCIDPGHQTAVNLQRQQAFTVSVGTLSQMAECDYIGTVSAAKVPDKLEHVHWHTRKAEFCAAPVIAELPLTLECRLLSYDKETGCAVGEILNVSADERVLDADGNVDPAKLGVLTFDPVHQVYRQLGEVAGKAFDSHPDFE